MTRTITTISIIIFMISCNKNEMTNKESLTSDTTFKTATTKTIVTADSIAFLTNWNNYVNNPSEINANIILDLIPNKLRLKQSDKEWNRNCLLFGNEDLVYKRFSKGIYKLDTLVMKKDPLATRIVLKLYFNTCLLKAEFGEIFDMDFAQMTISDPKFFLVSLKEAVGNEFQLYGNSMKFSFKNELYLNLDNMTDSLVSITRVNEKRKRIEALLTVQNDDLIQLRDSLISYEKEN